VSLEEERSWRKMIRRKEVSLTDVICVKVVEILFAIATTEDENHVEVWDIV
jgi:hypothetical protein